MASLQTAATAVVVWAVAASGLGTPAAARQQVLQCGVGGHFVGKQPDENYQHFSLNIDTAQQTVFGTSVYGVEGHKPLKVTPVRFAAGLVEFSTYMDGGLSLLFTTREFTKKIAKISIALPSLAFSGAIDGKTLSGECRESDVAIYSAPAIDNKEGKTRLECFFAADPGQDYRCHLDTGSPFTTLPNASWSARLRGIGSESTVSYFNGQPMRCQHVAPLDIGVGIQPGLVLHASNPLRCVGGNVFGDGIVGMDAVRGWVLRFEGGRFEVLDHAPSDIAMRPMVSSSSGRILIPVRLDNGPEVVAAFDTGWSHGTYAIARNLVLSNARSFAPVEGTLATARFVRGPDLSLGGSPVSTRDEQIRVLDRDEIQLDGAMQIVLGLQLVRSFTLVFDLQGNSWGLLPHKSGLGSFR